MSAPAPYPFVAVAGQDDAKLALILAAVDPGLGGVLLWGERGSAKTTLVRGLAGLLPQGVPFVELPLGASEDRVSGSLDIKAAIGDGQVGFRSGLLAAAHGGILYVDEVNLLADHLVDLLLDAAASGVHRVERDGFSHQHKARFVLVGSMNPEEGELRPQLADRFGLSVHVSMSPDVAERTSALERRLNYDADPAGFAALWAHDHHRYSDRLSGLWGQRSVSLILAGMGAEVISKVVEVCSALEMDGLRADIAMCKAAAALAAWEGRQEASVADVARVAPMVLAHRMRRSPLDQPGAGQARMEEVLDKVLRPGTPDAGSGPPQAPQSPLGGEASSPAGDHTETGGGPHSDVTGPGGVGTGSSGPPGGSGPGSLGFGAREVPSGGSGPRSGPEREGGEGEAAAALGGRGGGDAPPSPPPLSPPGEGFSEGRGEAMVVPPSSGGRWGMERGGRSGNGHSVAPTGSGRMAGARARSGHGGDIAAGATAAAYLTRRAQGGGRDLEYGDLRESVRQERIANLWVVVVDASGSMAKGRIDLAKEVVVELLSDAYQSRDKVALVSFRAGSAQVLLRPTGSVEVARARLDTLPVGGATPLGAGLRAGLELAQGGREQSLRPTMVVISDGRATTPEPSEDALAEAEFAGAEVAASGVGSVVIDAEVSRVRLGLARALAEIMGSGYVHLDDLSTPGSGSLAKLLRASVGSG